MINNYEREREREREFSKLFSINTFLMSTFSYNLIVCVQKESQNFLYTCNIFIVHSILGTFRPCGLHQSGNKNITLYTLAILRCCLTLKAPVTTAADDNFFYLFFFSEKTNLDISDDSHEMSRLVFSENKKKSECRLLQILLCALRVNVMYCIEC